MRRLFAALLATSAQHLLLAQPAPALADMYQDGSNAKLPDARNELRVTGPNWFNVRDWDKAAGTGGDDTAAVTAAVAAASAVKGVAYFPAGIYRLTSQTTTIPLDNVTLAGDGAPAGNIYGKTSSQFWVYSTSVSPFQLRRNVNWRGLGAYYPNQDGSTPAPIVYPALFGVSGTAGQGPSNVSITDFWFTNPYVLLKVDNTALPGAAGRIRIDNGLGYCVYSCFWLTNGIADTLHIGPNTYWGVGANEDSPNSANKYLAKFSIDNGEFIRIDTGAGGRTAVSAIILDSQIIFDYRYVVRVVSGTLNATLRPAYLDQVRTALSIESTGNMNGTLEVPGWIYSTNSFSDPGGANADPVVNCSASTATRTQLTIRGTRFQYSRGSVIETSGTCLDSLRVTGNQFANWGQSTTVGTYYGLRRADTGSAAVLVADNTFRSAAGFGATRNGVGFDKAAGTNTLSNNIFRALIDTPVTITAADSGSVLMNGNYASGSTAALSLNDASAAPVKVIDLNNNWDKAPVPTVSACGTSPSAVTGTDAVGTFVTGSGTVSACTLSYSRAKAGFPNCTFATSSASVGVGITSYSASLVTLGFSTSAPGIRVHYRCDLPLVFP